MSVIKVAAVKNTITPHGPIIVRNQSIHCPSLSAMLHSSTNQELFESTSVIKIANMKNTDDFRYVKEAITCNHQINAFHCQQRGMEHKGGHC